jgi:hypothetical protein
MIGCTATADACVRTWLARVRRATCSENQVRGRKLRLHHDLPLRQNLQNRHTEEQRYSMRLHHGGHQMRTCERKQLVELLRALEALRRVMTPSQSVNLWYLHQALEFADARRP